MYQRCIKFVSTLAKPKMGRKLNAHITKDRMWYGRFRGTWGLAGGNSAGGVRLARSHECADGPEWFWIVSMGRLQLHFLEEGSVATLGVAQEGFSKQEG